MPGSSSGVLPLHVSDISKQSSCRTSNPHLTMPKSFQLFDISEDYRFLVLIDNNFMLQAYEINVSGTEIVLERQTIKDVPCKINSRNLIYVYISVASKTGHVAVSFLQIVNEENPFKEKPRVDGYMQFKIRRKSDNKDEYTLEKVAKDKYLDKKYSNCRIYRENEEVLEIPFQGRAAFTKDSLVLVNRRILDIYDAKSFKKLYFFNLGNFYWDNYVYLYYFKCYQFRSWCDGYLSMNDNRQVTQEGHGIANISAHIRKNVVVIYDKSSNSRSTGSIKIWSTLTGSLICSLSRKVGDHVISISDDHSFLVTDNTDSKLLTIYCMKSGNQLCTYNPQGLKNGSRNSTIMFVKITGHQGYMLILGAVAKPNGYSNLFFEIFSIAQLKTVKYIEKDILINPEYVFAVDILQEDFFPDSANPLVYYPSKFHGVFLEKGGLYDRKVKIRKISLIDPESNGLIGERLWNIFSCRCMGTRDWKSGGLCTFDSNLDRNFNSTWYLLEKDTYKFVLRFSPHVMELWQLEINRDKKWDPFDFGTPFSNTQQLPRYYKETTKSTLIYTRSYYGIDYKSNSKVWGKPDLKIEGEDKNCKLYIHFTGDEGRVLVYAWLGDKSLIIDEILLPITELKSKISSDSVFLGALDIYNIGGDVSKDNSSNIESCLLALLYGHWLAQDYIRLNNTNSAIDVYNELVNTTSRLQKSIDLSINNTLYFQTTSASKILMRLVHYDRGLDIISAIILEKEFPITIFNHPINENENENENLLTVLIRKGQYDIFQVLFNQVILDYYNGSSVDLFPLMNALVCLQKKEMPGLLLKCIENLSYLPVNLTKAGQHNPEFYTLGDEKSFNNFTIFHQMKKHNSGILNLIYPRKSKVQKRDIDDPKRYFDLHPGCLIPLPTPDVYGAISYAILDKNSSYARTDSINERFIQNIPIIEVLLTHKWRNYVKGRFYIILFLQILYYIFYTVAISFPEEIFNYIPGSPIEHSGHLTCLGITLLTWILFLLQEVRQMVALKWEYWKSFYNYVDLLAGIFPLVTFILLITNGLHLYDISSITTLILCFHFLLGLRVNRRMGILIEIIIQLGIKIVPIIGLMIMLIISFTFSFIVLLRRQDDSFFQEQFEGNATPANESSPGSNIGLSDQSQQNFFKDVFLAFSTVWFFLYGIFDPILSGDVGNYPMALVLAILFSFITSLVILNVVIALMTGAIDETEKKGNRNWHIHLADISQEVENLLGRFIEKDSATYVYYHASTNNIELQHEKIEKETKKLKERLLKKTKKTTSLN